MMIPIRGIELHQLPTEGIRSYLYDRGPRHDHPTETHFHRGIDLPAPRGTPVHAAAAGKVEHAHDRYTPGFAGYGRVVVLAHMDGTRTLSAHLDTVIARHGQIVQEGAVIGTVGNSRFTRAAPELESGGFHLHFEARAGTYPTQSEAPRLDPIAWLTEGIRVAAPPFSQPPIAQLSSPVLCPHCGGSLELVRAGERA